MAFIPTRGYESETERGKVEMEMDRQRKDGAGEETTGETPIQPTDDPKCNSAKVSGGRDPPSDATE